MPKKVKMKIIVGFLQQLKKEDKRARLFVATLRTRKVVSAMKYINEGEIHKK